MKVAVDYALCEGHEQCVMQAPEVFEIGDNDEQVRLITDEPAEDQWNDVELASRMCPRGAITIEG
jgi:ferredoxin